MGSQSQSEVIRLDFGVRKIKVLFFFQSAFQTSVCNCGKKTLCAVSIPWFNRHPAGTLFSVNRLWRAVCPKEARADIGPECWIAKPLGQYNSAFTETVGALEYTTTTRSYSKSVLRTDVLYLLVLPKGRVQSGLYKAAYFDELYCISNECTLKVFFSFSTEVSAGEHNWHTLLKCKICRESGRFVFLLIVYFCKWERPLEVLERNLTFVLTIIRIRWWGI